MCNVMSFAEVDDLSVELLPTRTVLSLLRAPTGAVIGAPGGPGAHGSDGPSPVSETVSETWAAVLGNHESSTAR